MNTKTAFCGAGLSAGLASALRVTFLFSVSPAAASYDTLFPIELSLLVICGALCGSGLYYHMEPPNNQRRDLHIGPSSFARTTLAKEIARRGRLPVRECVLLGLDLTAALGRLRWHALLHGVITPANIIYIRGQPKLFEGEGKTQRRSGLGDATCLAPESFWVPEGAGAYFTAILSLGKVLYEAATGRPGSDFPELPVGLETWPDSDALLQLHEILLTACEANPADRYSSAAAMHADLLELGSKLGLLPLPTK